MELTDRSTISILGVTVFTLRAVKVRWGNRTVSDIRDDRHRFTPRNGLTVSPQADRLGIAADALRELRIGDFFGFEILGEVHADTIQCFIGFVNDESPRVHYPAGWHVLPYGEKERSRG